MNRHQLMTACLCLSLAGIVLGQDEPKEKEPPAVAELFEDDTCFLVDSLSNEFSNPGAPDGSIVERSEETFFSGKASLAVTEFQRFRPYVPQWKFKIAENPGPGEYRYLRFAWKRTEAPGIMLQLHARVVPPPRQRIQPPAWHRYYAGTVSKQTQSWGAMTRVDEEVPRQWKVVTRDLFEDFGPITIVGLGLSALEGPGQAYFDHIYLGRTIAELDGVTDAKKAIAEPAAAPESAGDEDFRRWLMRALAVAGVVAALLFGIVAWLRRSKAKAANPTAGPSDTPAAADGLIGFACSACGKHLKVKGELAGKRVKCPACGAGLVAP